MVYLDQTKNGGVIKTELQVDKEKGTPLSATKSKPKTNTKRNLAAALSLDGDDDDDDDDDERAQHHDIFDDDSHEDIQEFADDDDEEDGPPPLIPSEDEHKTHPLPQPQPPPQSHPAPTTAPSSTAQQTATQSTQSATKHKSSSITTEQEEEKDKETQPTSPSRAHEHEEKEQQSKKQNPDEPQTEQKEKEKEKEQEQATESKTQEEIAMDEKLRKIDECVQLFPKLEEGLDINIKFSDACDFEENPGFRMFSHYGIKLFHGWVIDPKNEALHKLVGDKSYDETIDFLISDPNKDATAEEKKQLEEDKEVVRKFFAESATQLTSYGLERLYALMDVEDELAIFFRNNHFSTIVKHNGILYEFVTDEGIVDADPQITWQTLLQISGDEQFVNNKFQSIHTNISQYTQIAQYNRMKYQTENGIAGVGTDDISTNIGGAIPNTHGVAAAAAAPGSAAGAEHKQMESVHSSHSNLKYPPHSLIGRINKALDFIDSSGPFQKLKKEEEDVDPLVSHGLTHRTTDTFDRFICKDFLFGMPLLNEQCLKLELIVRSFEMKDAKNILQLMTVAQQKDSHHHKNIDFMHHDHKYALVLEIADINDDEERVSADDQDEQQSPAGKHKEKKPPKKRKKKAIEDAIIGCIKYEWLKFNNWDWRESDWEDFDVDNIYNTNHYERRRQLREAGVRTDCFIHIIDFCVAPLYQNHGFGAQLLQSLIYAFPSGTRFGLDVSAENTPATKCIFKCGFRIARMEQQPHVKYKMTIESCYSFSEYQCWLDNSKVIQPKVVTIQHVQSNSNLNKNKSKGKKLQKPLQQTEADQHAQSQPQLHHQQQAPHAQDAAHGQSTHSMAMDEMAISPQSYPQGRMMTHGVDDDEEDADDVDVDEEEDYNGISQNIHLSDPLMTPQREHGGIHDPLQQNRKRRHVDEPYVADTDGIEDGTGDEDCGSDEHEHDVLARDVDPTQVGQVAAADHVHGAVMQGAGGFMPAHHEHDIMNNIGLFGYGDEFVSNKLLELNLSNYSMTFAEFQINRAALLHLEPSVVEFIIPDENDRNRFLVWLQSYKQEQQQLQATVLESEAHKLPSKPPPQQSSNMETGMPDVDDDDHY
eukprot:CAMPEP_0197037148 /NCGR_PEP_ID=MMETSP1384-20130603/14431_1 /TAXON_ID=29189 /ORGANISM="Ammonia sp." /LENGTH=1097 /DNA_ID=CAMNT_0042467411 /DNA_START=204 /DNA_END=3497 /DNA_ORIENTATION=+